MSKVKRFSLEERYGYQNRKVIYDKNADNDIELNNIYPIIDLFNQLDEQIIDLQHKLKVSEIATKLACKEIDSEYMYGVYHTEYPQYFKEQAEKEIKGE